MAMRYVLSYQICPFETDILEEFVAHRSKHSRQIH